VKQDYIPADPTVEEIVEEAYRPHADALNEVVGRVDSMLYRRDYWQSTLGNFLTDVLRSSQGTDISFFPAWRYGATLLPGPVTVEDIYNIIPTGGQITTYTMAGREVRTLLENILGGVADSDAFARVGGDMLRFSGLNIVYDLANGDGNRIVSITMADGQPFLAEKDYTIASVHTRFQENPLFGAGSIDETGTLFADVLIDYLRNNSPVTSALDSRITPRSGPQSFCQERCQALHTLVGETAWVY
jgi:sulfur-oxidizing protein SoxB